MTNKLICVIVYYIVLLIRDGDSYVTVPPSNVYFRLVDSLYDRYIADSKDNGDIVASICCYPDMLWHAIDHDGTWFRLENKATGDYLTTSLESGGYGNIFAYSGGKYDDQLWTIYTPKSDGVHFRLKNKYIDTFLVVNFEWQVFAYPLLTHDQFFRFDIDIDWNTCQSIGYEFVNENENNIFPSQAEEYTAEYTNDGPIPQSTDGVLQLQKCESNTVETTQETNWNVGVEASVGFSAYGADVSVSVSVSVGGSSSTTNSKTVEVCNTVSVNPPQCPAHYKCTRTFIISKIPETTKDIKVALNCGGSLIDWFGKLKVSGGAQVTFSDTFHPSGCFDYYSYVYNDRIDKLPFCWSCTTSSFCNQCEPGSAASVLLHINNNKVECITPHACVVYCKGEVKGDDNTPYYCNNPDVAHENCNWHLTNIADVYSDAHSFKPNFIYPQKTARAPEKIRYIYDEHFNVIIVLLVALVILLCFGIVFCSCLFFKKSSEKHVKIYDNESDVNHSALADM